MSDAARRERIVAIVGRTSKQKGRREVVLQTSRGREGEPFFFLIYSFFFGEDRKGTSKTTSKKKSKQVRLKRTSKESILYILYYIILLILLFGLLVIHPVLLVIHPERLLSRLSYLFYSQRRLSPYPQQKSCREGIPPLRASLLSEALGSIDSKAKKRPILGDYRPKWYNLSTAILIPA